MAETRTFKNLLFSFVLSCICLTSHAQTITTVVGNHSLSGSRGNGGPATAASFYQQLPYFDVDQQGNFFIMDSFCLIRKVDTHGIIHYFAGSGSSAYNGENIPATAAGMNIESLLVDRKGNVIFGEYEGARIRKIDSRGMVNTIAGGVRGSSGDGGPASAASIGDCNYLAVDNVGNIYISDETSVTIRKVDTNGFINVFAGNGTTGFSGDGGPATAAALGGNGALATDRKGNVYFADNGNFRIRKISPSGIITTVAGNGGYTGLYLDSVDGGPATTARVAQPDGMALDWYGNLYYTQTGYNTVRMVDTNGNIHYLANRACAPGYTGDGGPATAATMYNVECIWVDSQGTKVYIADSWNRVIRRIQYPPFPAAVESVTTPALDVTLSPNPTAGGHVTLLVNSITGETARVMVTDAQGRVYKQFEVKCCTATTCDVKGPPGIYVVNVVVGSKEWHGKLVVE